MQYSTSLFSQVLRVVPRFEFQWLAMEHHAERHVKGFTCWGWFLGASPNALKVQIWTALIAVLLLRYLQFRSRCQLALCRLVALLRLNLFSYRNLWQ